MTCESLLHKALNKAELMAKRYGFHMAQGLNSQMHIRSTLK